MSIWRCIPEQGPQKGDAKVERDQLQKALAGIDAANAKDPNLIEVDGERRPAELVYGERMSAALRGLHSDASPELQIAVRAQHIERWKLPRADYPQDRAGYHRWRNDQKKRHADVAGAIMAEVVYDDDRIARVGSLIRKERLKRDAEAQALEDVACLVFLEHYFPEFSAKHDDDKLVDILRKTWVKMSEKGHQAALKLDLPAPLGKLVERALAVDK